MQAPTSIESDEARDLAEKLAHMTGRGVREVVIDSLRDRLARVRYAVTPLEEQAREREIGFYNLIAGSRALWKGAALSLDHGDLLYDEWGLPR